MQCPRKLLTWWFVTRAAASHIYLRRKWATMFEDQVSLLFSKSSISLNSSGSQGPPVLKLTHNNALMIKKNNKKYYLLKCGFFFCKLILWFNILFRFCNSLDFTLQKYYVDAVHKWLCTNSTILVTFNRKNTPPEILASWGNQWKVSQILENVLKIFKLTFSNKQIHAESFGTTTDSV